MAKKLSERITLEKNNDKLFVEIKAYNEKWKESVLMAWVGAWTFCGIYFLFEIISNYNNTNFVLFMAITLGFWLYFEVKVVKALLWRITGKEVIEISPSGFTHKSFISKFASTKKLTLSNINKFEEYIPSANSFSQFMGRGFWIIGGESIEVKNVTSPFIMARELSDKEIHFLTPILNRSLDEFKRVKK